MTTKTLRLPENLRQAVQELSVAEHIEEATAMRKLLSMGYERFLADQYRAGHISLREVASRLEVSLSDALERLQHLGITGNTGAADTLASLESLRPE
ncbi:MAG: hypothetical protein WCY01_04930 [Alkalispirochaeta sp.]